MDSGISFSLGVSGQRGETQPPSLVVGIDTENERIILFNWWASELKCWSLSALLLMSLVECLLMPPVFPINIFAQVTVLHLPHFISVHSPIFSHLYFFGPSSSLHPLSLIASFSLCPSISSIFFLSLPHFQSLAMKYQFLRSVSFPCPSSGSRLEDMTTSCLSSSPVSVGLGSSSHPHELMLSELSALSDSLHISQVPSTALSVM